MKIERTCGNCRFRDGQGRCHRNPPKMAEDFSQAEWPMVPFAGWCGEWRPVESFGALNTEAPKP